ncbi:probable LRR receptor-like serine/threonine-protein kinase At1g07650 isoform X2 [Fagus crenata]
MGFFAVGISVKDLLVTTLSCPRSISVNNLSGRIDYLGSITTLKALSIESKLFSGPVPRELANLVDLETLILNANNLTGELPVALTSLTKLNELRISSNNFTGRIPDIFQSWKQLQKLEIQASGLEGPIPPSISVKMLRSCNISGQIPGYISEMTQLKILDLSFNRLDGNIPNLDAPTELATIYLTRNLLSGSIPDWIKGRDSPKKISYNNFSERSAPNICPETLNNPCSKDRYSLHINCGGNETTIGNIKYEADLEPGGAAKFVRMKDDSWGFSSTGDFWDIWSTAYDYIAKNGSMLKMNDSELYMDARLSPLSLTYYARCLAKGNYTVKLHFAEIIFRDNRSFSSVGRRIFDVYIQEELVLKDFDMEKEAQGVDKAVVRNFTAVVKNKILEIHFYWAGKGTKDIPKRGTYGPLISAISIKSAVPITTGCNKILITVGAVLSVSSLIVLILGILWWKGCLGGRTSREQVLRGLDLQTGFFTFKQIKAATNNFDAANKLGQGGFGSIYKGTLLDGTIIAVKQLSSKSKQGNREFVNEIGMVSGLQHPNLALVSQQKGNLMDLVDPKLGSDFSKEEAVRMVKVALLCTNPSPTLRPTMSAVVGMLEGQTAVHELIMDPSIYADDTRFKALRDYFDQIMGQGSGDTQSLIHSSDATWIGSSATLSSPS